MKAVLCKKLGPPETLVIEDVPELTAGPGQVVIDTYACGANFPDVLIIEGKYQEKPDLPFSPGAEVAGIISAVGEGVSDFSVGDRVLAYVGNGGYAQQVVTRATRVVPIPDEMDFNTASAFLLTYGTSYHGLKQRGQLKPGETLLVLGAAGGVGLAAVELGKAMGARVIAAASTDDKLALCQEHGADELINYSTEDVKERVKELTGGAGADVVYDPVGGDFSEATLRATAWNGRFLVIGFANGEIPRIPLNLTLLKGCQIVGVFWGAFTERQPEDNRENNRELMQFYVEGKVKPHISAVYPLEQAVQAMHDLSGRKVKGKVVIACRDS